MLKLNLLISIMMLAGIVSAQPKLSKDFTVTNSEPYEVVDANTKEYFTDYKGFTYSVKTRRDKIIIQKFEVSSMKEVARKEYKDVPPYLSAIKVIKIGEKFYYLFESLDKKADTKSVHVREFLTEDCSLGKERVLLTSDGEVANGNNSESIGFMGMGRGPSFSVYKSFDNSKIMINYRRKPLSKSDAKNHDLIGFFVYNSSLELIWGKEVEMPYTEKQMNNLAYTVGAEGKAYMMSLNRETRKFQLITVPETGEISVKDIEGKDFMFKDLYMKENKDGNIDFLGFYANGLDFKFWEGSWGNLSVNTNGIRYFELSKEGEILKSNNIEFPIELINKYVSERQQNKNEKREEDGKAGIRDVVLRQFTTNPDGSVFILGEQYYYSQSFNYKTKTMNYQIYYQDLIATKLNSEGEVLWMTKLPKRQYGTNGRGGMGIAYLEGASSHFILFLDNIKNADINIDEVPAKHTDGLGGYLTAYKIDDENGKFTKHPIYNSREVNGVKTHQFETSRIFEAMDNILLVEVYIKGKKDMIIKMELAN